MEYGSPYKSISHRKFNTWCNYPDRIDTYGQGCAHGCKYCYAKALLNFRNYWNEDKPLNSNMVDIVKKIRTLQAGSLIRLGSMTDCFQPIEAKKRITYCTIKWLNKYRIHYLIVTKGSLVTSDEYLEIYDKDLAHFQISISNTQENDIEKCSSLKDRISSIEKLYKLGFDVSIRLSPFLFNMTDLNIINSIHCDKILIEFLKLNHWIKKSFKIDNSDYTLKFGGHQNLKLNHKIDLVKKITGFNQVSVGEYVRPHYEYFRDHVNFNKLDCCNLNYKPLENHIKQLTLF
jgi:DNA repair photolyase